MPKWVQLYFSGTRFWDKGEDRWFIPFEGEDSRYHARRGAIEKLLAQRYPSSDVEKVRRKRVKPGPASSKR